MATDSNFKRLKYGLSLIPNATTLVSSPGDIDYDLASGQFNFYEASGVANFVSAAGTQVLTNKTINVSTNSIVGTVGTAAQFNPSTGNLESSVTTSTELGYVHGVTSNIQTQLDALAPSGNYITALTGDVTATGPGSVVASLTATTNSTLTTLTALSLPGSQVTGNISGSSGNVTGTVGFANGGTNATTAAAAFNNLTPMTTTGDLEYESATNVASRLPIGSTGQVLTVNAGIPAWQTFAALTNPMTSTGDIIYSSNNSGTPARLPIGTVGQVLEVSGGGIPTWVNASGGVPTGVPLLFAGATTISATVAQSASTTTFSNAINTSTYIGQGFTPTTTGTISTATVSLSWTGGSQPTGSMNVQIYTNASGVPGSLLCVSVDQDAGIITGTPTPITFTITSGVTLTSGTEYFLVWEPYGVTFNSSTIQVNTDNTNPYAGGTAVISLNGGTSYTISSGNDLQFSVNSSVSNIPSGYLYCDGTAYSRTTYANLFAVIATNFGVGDGSTTFNVPDTRGAFTRGVSDASGNDPDASSRTAVNGGNAGNNVGSSQGWQIQSHTHEESYYGGPSGTQSYTNIVYGTDTNYPSGAFAATYTGPGNGQFGPPVGPQNAGAATFATGGNQTNPINVYFNYIIKF